MEELPKTFHDAIELCVQLKIRYIWIDSLCIIQDDKEDWKRESVTMIDVYGSCLLNIAASSSINGSQGCFFDRQDAIRCRISLKIEGKDCAMYDCAPRAKHPLDDPEVCPLESRGWTFQERLLSPRTVHFTREEVFWECHTKFVPESSPLHSHRIKKYQKKEPLSIDIWSKLVMNYSGRHLTYESDKLIALAGIAAKIQQQTKDEYFAGMWRNNLINQLCWYVPDHEASRRISPQRAPTWSWASVASRIFSYEDSGFEGPLLSRGLKVEKPATENQFGDMPNAPLWLSCPQLLHIKFIPPNTTVFDIFFETGAILKFDCVKGLLLANMNSKMYKVYMLRICDTRALILKGIEKAQGVYERIGYVMSFTWAGLSLNHAEDTAYIPRDKHKFDTDEHVICLI
ncbi:hypothetical protein EAE96_005911 [Botrytis aclada]|nr:hypothetical protein EAE96_005911 [Botrytis aclada]